MPCDNCGGNGYVIMLEEPFRLIDPAPDHPEALVKTKQVPCVVCTFAGIGQTLHNLQEPAQKIVQSFNDLAKSMSAQEWADLREEHYFQTGRQLPEQPEFPTDPEELCCLCHEEVGGGYPPAAFVRRQAPYTYMPDLEGWAHDVCAEEYRREDGSEPPPVWNIL